MPRRFRLGRPRIKELVARVTFGSAIGYAAASYSASRWLTRRAPGAPRQNPGDFGLAFEALECRTMDGMRLAGWVAEPDQPLGTIALFHGLRGSRVRMLPRLAILAGQGFRVVSFDHRAHGRSSGKRTSFGFHERLDVVAIHRLIHSRWPQQPVAALGSSMGAAALCYAAEFQLSWRAMVLEGIYRDIGSAFARRIGSDYPAWFGRLYPGVVRVTERRLGLRLEQLTPLAHVGRLGDVPILFITGMNDRFAPPADAEQVAAQCRGPRDLWVVPNAGHSDVFDKGGEVYQNQVTAFFRKWMT